MTGNDIRSSFVQFFERHNHRYVPSASLIPGDDPTLLFTSAGMVPFKGYFSGAATPPHKRLTSYQKCLRTTDISEVGDDKHLTFFEMLGNFSIGDYFKEDAIMFAWEFLVDVLGLPAERLYATVHLDDVASYAVWRTDLGLPSERVYFYADNWWGPAGNSGPTGPCSEIHYYTGEGSDVSLASPRAAFDGDVSAGCHPNDARGNFVELWNLVFMQFFQDTDSTRSMLPAPGVDTGLGLERLAMILQGKDSVYDTDLFYPLLKRVGEYTGKGDTVSADYRIIADHVRALHFLLWEDLVPGNKGREYMVRRLIRRTMRSGYNLGITTTFIPDLMDVVTEMFSSAYPDLRQRNSRVYSDVVRQEESIFSRNLVKGMSILDKMLSGVGDTLAGKDVFHLYDTYGFPPDMTADICMERGVSVHLDDFEREMDLHRIRSRAPKTIDNI